MTIVFRSTRRVAKGKWDEYMDLRSQISTRAEELGLRPGRLYRPFLGGGPSDLATYEREFENLADMERGFAKLLEDPLSIDLHDKMAEICEPVGTEVARLL